MPELHYYCVSPEQRANGHQTVMFYVEDGHLFLRLSFKYTRNGNKYSEYVEYMLTEDGVLTPRDDDTYNDQVREKFARVDLAELYNKLMEVSQNDFQLPDDSAAKVVRRY